MLVKVIKTEICQGEGFLRGEITWAQTIIFFCQLPFCVDAIVAAQVTQEPACVLSVCKLVCIVCARMYSCPLHRTILSSTLFFLGTLFLDD